MLLRSIVLLLWFLVLACHGTIFAGFLPEAQAQTYCMTTSESWVLDSKRSRSCQQDISGMVSDRDVSAMLCDIFVVTGDVHMRGTLLTQHTGLCSQTLYCDTRRMHIV